MNLHDSAVLAARNAVRRPGRVVLTVLAVALATTLLTALVTIARTAETRVLDQVAEGGPVSGISVIPAEPTADQADQDLTSGGEFRPIDDGTVDAIRALDPVAEVLPVVSTPVFVVRAERVDGSRVDGFRERMVGVDTSRPARIPVTPLAGRLPAPGSTVDVAVTESFLKRLGLERTDADTVLGTELEVAAGRIRSAEDGPGTRSGDTSIQGRWRRLTIVGVVAQGAGSGQLVVSVDLARQNWEWTTSGIDAGDELGASPSPYAGLFVVARGIDNVGPARDAITGVGYASSAPENLIASVDNYLGVVEIVLAAVGLIALVVAAIGIANAMLAAIRERRREIGVLKALGARDRDILRIFVLEAAVLGLAGGVLGTLLGNLAARVVGAVVNGYLADQALPGVALVFPLEVVIGGIVGPTLVAAIGGAIPAWKASRISPREAVNTA